MSTETRTPGPFFHAAGRTGVLLLHGLSGSAYVFQDLAATLARDGVSASASLLAGHGTTPEEMETTTLADWIGSAVDAYDQLAERCDRVYVGGVSFGGLVAAEVSLRRPVAGIILIGTPLRLEHQQLMRLGTLVLPLIGKRFYEKGSTRFGVKYYEKAGNDLKVGNEIFAGANFSYRKMPVKSVRQLLPYLRQVRKHLLATVSAPALIIESRDDGLSKAGNGELLLKELGSQDKRLVWTERSHHALRETLAEPGVYETILAFVSQDRPARAS